MGLIRVLPELLVNRIAAGEVIERPASVAKELLENAIDAEATRIEVAVEEGGLRLIRVTDDGIGMAPEDVGLSVLPHATSKIEREDDLYSIRTLGFRGEALASIGAVADLRIVSRPRDADEACEIRATPDGVEGPKPAGAPPGTTVEVRDLFASVPARRKFLRAAQTEFGHIVEQVARVALPHPRIDFRVTHNGREVYRLPKAESLHRRLADFFGPEVADGLIAVHRAERGLEVTGLVGVPAQSRSTARWQYTFLNGRYVRDRFVQHAIREAYRGLMDPQRHPVVFVMLSTDPTDVDVNVHPTKIEVRWRDSNVAHSVVLAALRDTFLQNDLTTPLTARGDADAERRRQHIRQAMAECFKSHPPPSAPAPYSSAGGAAGSRPAMAYPPSSDAPELSLWGHGRPAPAAGSAPGGSAIWRGGAGVAPGAAPDDGETSAGPEAKTADDAERATMPPVGAGAAQSSSSDDARAAGAEASWRLPERAIQIHRTYLVAETEEGLLIVDQHALHERVLYQQLSAQVTHGPLASQRLLLPVTVDVPAEAIDVLESSAELLAQLGLELTATGPSVVAVHAAPTLLRDRDLGAFVRDMMERLAAHDAPTRAEAVLEDLLQMMACKAAVKAGDPLTPEEMQALLAQRESLEKGTNCPHGRPTMLRLSVADLERQFKRA